MDPASGSQPSGFDAFVFGASGAEPATTADTSSPVAFTSVAPPGWTPAPAPAPATAGAVAATATAVAMPAPTLGALKRSTPADAAVRWRLRAATIDNILICLAYDLLCLPFHGHPILPSRLSTLSLSQLLMFTLVSVVYHFAFEATSGQTPGKQRAGIQVVSVDGGRADAKAIAVRSVLRIADQLPVAYASGLVSMIRTGPERRQRIGDVAGRTMVVAVDGRAVERGTASWFLPAATVLAVALSALLAFQLTRAGSEPLTAQDQAAFIAGCQATGGPTAPCGCMLQQLEADGYDSPNSMRSLLSQIQTAIVDRNLREVPPEMLKAARVCGA